MTTEQHLHATFCHSIGIRIYAKAVNSIKCILIVERHGKQKIGNEVYDQTTDKQKENWSSKIRLLYREYYAFYKAKEKIKV